VVMSSKALTDMKRRPGEVGRYFFIGMGQTPWNMLSIFCPSASVTTAFFQFD
jgi:hypothetical protein